jgi:hypothetical protein
LVRGVVEQTLTKETERKGRKMRWAELVARIGERNAYNILVGKPVTRRRFGTRRNIREDNTKRDLKEEEW